MQRQIRLLVERFTDEELSRIGLTIEREFSRILLNKQVMNEQPGPIAPEIKAGENLGDEYRYLIINDELQCVAFIRRTDRNQYEMMLSSFY